MASIEQTANEISNRMRPRGIPQEIIAALLATRKKITSIKKDEFNPHDKYNYVSIDTYYEKVATAATEAGLCWRSRQVDFTLVENQGKDRNRTYLRLMMQYDLMAGSSTAEAYSTFTIMLPLAGAQTTGVAVSYADKVFMRTTFCVPSGEKDADAEAQDEFLSPKKDAPMAAAVRQMMDANTIQWPVYQPASIQPSDPFPTLKGDDIPDFLRRPELPGSPSLHDADGVIPAVDTKLFPSFADGLPIGKVDAITPPGVGIIEEVFKVFMPLVKTQKALTQWHTDNVPALDAVEKIDPNAYLRIKNMLRVRFDELASHKKG